MSIKMSASAKDTKNAWNLAISDAERKIQESVISIAQLQRAVKTFKELRDNDEPFPDESSRQNEAQHVAAQ